MPRVRLPLLLCLAVLLAAPGSGRSDADVVPPLAREMADLLGFGDAELQRLVDGEIVAVDLEDGSRKELALAVAMLIPVSHERIYAKIRGGEWFDVDRTVLAKGELPASPVTAADFAELQLEEDELAKLASAEPGSVLNLSKDEIAGLRSAAGGGSELVQQTFRALLAERVEAYRRKGMKGVEPYARRHGDEASAADDLRTAAKALDDLDDRCSEFYESFVDFPRNQASAVESRFFWSLQDMQERPTVVLSHWLMRQHEGYGLVAERVFYASQSLNALQVVAGAFALGDDRSIVFYTNRTATDQVAGFGSPAAHAIGGRILQAEVVALFQSMRTGFAQRAQGDTRRPHAALE